MSGSVDLTRLSPTENLSLGLITGCLTKLVNYPLLTWKNTVQQSLPISFNPAVVYRGLPMAMLNFGGTTSVQFLFTSSFQKIMNSSGGKLSARDEMMGAFLGGLTSGIPNSVWELIMIQQQRFGGTLVGTPANLVREHGIVVLSRGMVPTMGRESLFTMAMLGICPVVQRQLKEGYGLPDGQALAVGALSSAIFSATLTHPLDTIKTCMQGDVSRQKYSTMTETGKLLSSEFGVVQGLFKGLSLRIGLIAASFFLVNKWKQIVAPLMFPHTVDADAKTE